VGTEGRKQQNKNKNKNVRKLNWLVSLFGQPIVSIEGF
jgi:hypothetical protein